MTNDDDDDNNNENDTDDANDNNDFDDERDYYEMVIKMYLSISLPQKSSPYTLCPSLNQVECYETPLNLQSLRLLYNS